MIEEFEGVDNMKVQTGYIYHIKDEFFDKINDKGLMINHENGYNRPTYFTIKDKDILGFIPLSSKVSKYQSIVDKNGTVQGLLVKLQIRNRLYCCKMHFLL